MLKTKPVVRSLAALSKDGPRSGSPKRGSILKSFFNNGFSSFASNFLEVGPYCNNSIAAACYGSPSGGISHVIRTSLARQRKGLFPDPICALRRISLESSNAAAGVLFAKNRRWKNVAAKTSKFSLSFGSAIIPHPQKVETGGEDALFIGTNCAGLADGVGGWRDMGIDAGIYSKSLMRCAHRILSEDDSVDLKNALHCAAQEVTVQGSSTACLLRLRGDVLQLINLGDSGFIIIRDQKHEGKPFVVMRSSAQQHSFNFPFQLGASSTDKAADADEFFVKVKPGDIVVVASDGVFDNLFDHDIIREIFNSGAVSPQDRATRLARVAHIMARTTSSRTPFAVEANAHGFNWHGGKVDDVSVIVAEVGEELPTEVVEQQQSPATEPTKKES